MTAPVDKADRPRCPVDIDLIDPDTFADGLPLEKFAAMRESAPVFWHDQEGAAGDGFWVVTRHADVQEVSRTPEVFSSYERGALLHTGPAEDEEQALEMTRMLMLNMDPPEHSDYRNIVQRAFTPRTIRNLEPRLEEFANEIVDRSLAKGTGDFVKDIAAELPLLAICELVGVPAEDRGIIFDLSNRLIGFDDPEFRNSPEDAQIASAEMYMYADGIAAARRECPMDDVASRLLAAEVDGTALSQDQFDVFFLLLMVAGNETTRNAISHGMQAFFEHPDQWELFKKERPLDTAVEEIIRWATPVMQFQRTAQSDYVLAGQSINKGDRVAIYYSAANRDETALTDPDTFDITRETNEHIAFGGGGPHFCLGANLARAEIRIMFNVIADRMPDIKATGDPRMLRSMFINGIKEIPVKYA
ncbi:MAG: steroid C27-monooxygenase [Frankiales bacterium]|nr:steroid C27-monooxygenase [Frankiales bacterium]